MYIKWTSLHISVIVTIASYACQIRFQMQAFGPKLSYCGWIAVGDDHAVLTYLELVVCEIGEEPAFGDGKAGSSLGTMCVSTAVACTPRDKCRVRSLDQVGRVRAIFSLCRLSLVMRD